MDALNFISLNNVPCQLHSSPLPTTTTSFINKRRRPSRISLCLEPPRRRPTSLSVRHDPDGPAPQTDSLASRPGEETPASFASDQETARDPRTKSNGIASNGVASHAEALSPAASNRTPADPSVKHPVDHTAKSHVEDSDADSTSSIPISIGDRKFSIPARWMLYTVPFLWGSFGPAVRLLFSQEPHQDASLFNTERLLLSTLVYFPVLAAELQAYLQVSKQENQVEKPVEKEENHFAFFPAGIELGVYVFLANVAQVIGLQQTSASRAAFLVQLQTVIVPVLSGLFGLDKISPRTWISSIVAVGGVALLSSDKSHGTVASLTGDSLEILSALFFSSYIIRLGKYCNKVAATPLVATKIATQAILSIGWAFVAELGILLNHAPTQIPGENGVAPWTVATIGISVGVVAWTGFMSSAVSGWLQTKGQQGVPASEAVVIFATQPLWASALAAVILGESFGSRGYAGGALIVAATLLASKSDDKPDKSKES